MDNSIWYSFFYHSFYRKKIKLLQLKKWQEILLFFVSNIIILSILEFLSGELILAIGKIRYWNYENLTWNIDGFICLEVSLFWGLASLFIEYFLYPRIKNFLKKIPKYLTIIFVILYVLDLLYMIIRPFINLNK